MNRDRIAEPRYPNPPAAPGRGEAHVWRVELPSGGGREVARRALREILGAYLGQAPGSIALTLGERGKPTLVSGERGKPAPASGARGKPAPASGARSEPAPAAAPPATPPPLAFNLSHSGGLALVAVAAGGTAVGVDVERLRPRRDLVRLAARWLPAADGAAVAAATGGEREAVFYAAWTRHEARAKCTGAGLSGPPPGPEVVALALEIDAGYAAALGVDTGAQAAPALDAGAASAADACGLDPGPAPPTTAAPISVRRFEFTV